MLGEVRDNYGAVSGEPIFGFEGRVIETVLGVEIVDALHVEVFGSS